ncbi:MAG: SDR family NAD(P)-dependent oxidoreductase [Acetivibrionales bacterium]|jgi:3-oxoacyl-[acyl-carrier protein] reductase
MLLKDKVALITGCNRGIGKAILEKFAQNGAIIYANARTDGCLDEAASNLSEKYGAEVVPVYFDVTDDTAVKECFMRIRKEKNRLDVLVNNAGIMKNALLGMIDQKTVGDIFAVNVIAPLNLMQYAIRFMDRQRSGSIINMASYVGIRGSAGQAAYSASKGAVIALTKSAAKELGPKGIRVNAIAPGIIDTDLISSIDREKMEANISRVGLGRTGNPDEVADAALFLASDMSMYISGQILCVDGCAEY